jgi:hypothetical protein
MNDQLDAVQIVESLARQISEYAQRVAILEAENKKLVQIIKEDQCQTNSI